MADYFCDSWNHRNPDRLAEQVRVFFMREMTPAPGSTSQTSPETIKLMTINANATKDN